MCTRSKSKKQSFFKAEKYYVRGLQKDTATNEARLNLSVAYNLAGRNNDALKTLQDALKTAPESDRVYYNLALLYNEMNNKACAEESLTKAAALHSQNPRVYYNYGLLLQQKGKIQQAISQMKKAVELSPNDADLNYALCSLYMQTSQTEKARRVAHLKRLAPGSQQYEATLRARF